MAESKKTRAESNMHTDLLVNQRYRLGNEIGRGSFGVVYWGFDEKKCTVAAIKLEENQNIMKKQQLSNEYDVYNLLRGGPGIPKCHWFGTFDNRHFNVLVMDLLGPSLEELFIECGHGFSLKTVLMLADQVITIVEFLHHKNLVHRDLKPNNFVMGIQNAATKLYLIDFGLARQYRNPISKEHIEYRDYYLSLTGTARYASLNNHIGIEQSRRDDLESIAYMFIYFLEGSLPWQSMHIKIENRFAKCQQIHEKKKNTSTTELCGNNPREFAMFLDYCRVLRFEEDPHYKYIKKLFRDLFHKCGFKHDLVFDWMKRGSTSVPSSESLSASDTRGIKKEACSTVYSYTP